MRVSGLDTKREGRTGHHNLLASASLGSHADQRTQALWEAVGDRGEINTLLGMRVALPSSQGCDTVPHDSCIPIARCDNHSQRLCSLVVVTMHVSTIWFRVYQNVMTEAVGLVNDGTTILFMGESDFDVYSAFGEEYPLDLY